MTQFANHHLGLFIEAGALGSFRVGVSELDGPDTLASGNPDSFEWVEFSQYMTEASIDNGVSFDGVQATYDGSNAVITLFDPEVDPTSGYLIKVGSRIRLTLEDYVPSIASQPFYTGIIKSIERIIDDLGNNTIRITAGDSVQNALSQTLDYLAIATGQTAYYRLQALKDAIPSWTPTTKGINTIYAYPYRYEPDSFVQGDYVIDGSSVADFVNETTLNEAGWLVADTDGVPTFLPHKFLTDQLSASPIVTFSEAEHDSEIAISHLNRDSSTNNAINSYRVEATYDALTFFTGVNQDSADLYGLNHQDIAVNLDNDAEFQKYLDYLLTFTGQQKIKSISADAIHHKNRKLSDVWKLWPGQTVLVDVTMGTTTINENYVVSRVQHQISPDIWVTDVELWRNN
jgi:hypothetical protein